VSQLKETYVHRRAVLIGSPNRRLELSQTVRATGFYGISRAVATVNLRVDDPAGFDASLRRAR
jgi:hypothetical protein